MTDRQIAAKLLAVHEHDPSLTGADLAAVDRHLRGLATRQEEQDRVADELGVPRVPHGGLMTPEQREIANRRLVAMAFTATQ